MSFHVGKAALPAAPPKIASATGLGNPDPFKDDATRSDREGQMPDRENFAGVASRAGADPARARVVIVQAPYEGTVSYGRGTAAGPRAILDASCQVETYDDETGIDLEDLSFALGPVVDARGEDARAYSERVQAAVRGIVAGHGVPFVLGGEHSVTIGAVRAVRELHPRTHVLSIDAHADLRDRYEGTDHSHACVCRRLLEKGPVTIVGVRSYSAEEARFASEAVSLRLVPAREVGSDSFRVDELVSSLGRDVYITLDVDGLDPSVVPATGTPEPGGLLWKETLEILRHVCERRTVVGMDIVELAPHAESRVSEFTVARLAAKMLTYLGPGDPR
jgi:agmatinase